MDPKSGGPCQGLRNSIPELKNLGLDSEVVSFDNPSADYLGKDPFKIHALGTSITPWRYNKKLVPWLLENFDRFDSVTVHGLWLYHSQAAIKALLKFKKTNSKFPRIYVMTHGMLDPYFQKAEDRKLKAFRNDVYWKIFENNVINNANGMLFTCEEELLLARTSFPNYKPKREINVAYGIQPPPMYTKNMREVLIEKVPQWNKEPFLVFLSRIHPKKGIDLMIKGYLKLEKELGKLPQLIIAGPGLESSYGQEMQNLAKPSSSILFPGMLSGDAKWGAFYESEAFVLSSHQENFGIAVAEALACTKPVLISNKVNIWREIEKDRGGIVKNDTEEDTYKTLKEWLLLSPEEKTKMSENAYISYKNHFTISQAAKKFKEGISK
jgi:glycosyltransferase involved in cell wall biosynthesis